MKSILNNKHRILALLLSVAMLAALLPVSVVPVFAAGGTWQGDGLTEETAYQIADAADLAKLAENTNNGESYQDKYFKLTDDIDLTEWLAANGGSEGWTPIGTMNTPFLGNFDGQNHIVSGLWMERPDVVYTGLFGYVQNNEISSVFVETAVNKAVSGRFYTGSLVGYASRSTIRNCGGTGIVNAVSMAGGLVGYQYGGLIDGCHFSGKVTIPDSTQSNSYAGGLVGHQQIDAVLQNSSANAAVSGYQQVGGLLGGSAANQCTVKDCFSTGTVSGCNQIGGLAGQAESLLMERCYSESTVMGTNQYIGGLIGYNSNYETRDCFASGAVSGASNVGGLIGLQSSGQKTIENCYAVGAVTGNSCGGFIGIINVYAEAPAIINHNFFDTDTTGQAKGIANSDIAGITEKTTSEMKQKATFQGWNFEGDGINPPVWYIRETQTYPQLGISVDYILNGMPYKWLDSTIYLSNDGDTLEVLSNEGPSTPVKISVTPPSDSEVSITGRSGVNYENLYIEAEGDNLVLKLADLEITPPKDKNNPDKDKNAVCFTGDSSHTISVSGECSMHSESDSYFNAGAVRDVSGSLTITGGVLNASYSGDGSGNAVYAGKDLNIETEVNVLSDYNGINAGGNIFVDGGKVTARGVNGTKSSSGLYSMGNIYIKNGGTVISEPAAHVGVYYGINASKGVIVSDTSKVNLNGGNGGVAILVNDGDFKVSGNAEVTAAGGDSNINGGGNGIVVWTGVAEISDNAVVKTNGGINTTERQDISVGGDGMTLCGSASLILNGGTLKAVGGRSELGSGGNGIYITEQGVTVHNGQLTAGGGRGVYGGRGIYSQLEMQIESGTVNVSGGVSQESANGSIGAGLRASGLTVSGGSLTAAGGNGKQSDEDINAHDFAGPGIYTWNDITVTGGSVKAYGAKGILGGYGIMTAYGSVSVSGGADFEVIGGTGTQNNGGVAMYVDFNDFKAPFTVDNSAGNVYIRGGQSEDTYLGESPAVMATYSYIATGNIGMIEAVQGEIKNAPGGDDVYMVKADTSPLAPGALFESVVKTETAGLSPSYAYLSSSGADGIGYLWLPANQQIVSSENYGDGAVKVETDNDSKVTLYTGYNITVNYKEDTEVIESETPAAGLGETFNLTAPQGYALPDSVSPALTLDSSLLAGGTVGGCNVTVSGQNITVDVPVAPLEIALTVNYKTSSGETVGTQNLDKNYNSVITSGDLNLPTGYTLTGFNEFKLNSGTEGLTFDFTDVPKPTAEITVTVTAGGIKITALFISGTEVGSCTFTKAYGSEITREDLTLPVGYKLTDKFANILVTDENITIQPGEKTGTVEIDAEPIQYTVNAVFKDGSEQVGNPFTVAKTIGQTVTAHELNVPAGYTLQNYTDIKIDEVLILGASGETHTFITVDVAVAPLEIVLTVNYETSSGETVGTQSINKYYNTLITSNDLLLPMGYALTGFEEFKLNSGTAGIIFDFNAVPKPTAEITVTAEAKEYEITVTFVSAAQAGTCTFKKAYGSEITEEDLTLPAGYRLTDKFSNIMVTDTDITIPPGGNTGTVEIAVEPIPYTVNVVFKDGSEQVGGVFAVVSEKTIGQSVTAAELEVPAGYALHNFSGIEIDESLILKASENIITLDIAVEVQKIALTIYYKNEDEQIGSVQMLNKDATSVLTEDELSIPFGYHLESDWNDIFMDNSESFDVYQVINASGTAEKTVQVRPNSVGVTVRFVQGTEDRGTQEFSADYGTVISAGDLNGMDAGYRLPDSFAEITVNQSEQRLIFENDTSAVLNVQVVPAEYIVTVRYNDKNGTEYTMQQPVSYAGTITNITNVPEGYYLDSFSGILLDSGNSNVIFDHETRTALVNAAVLPYDYTVTINYFDGAVFVGREQIVSAYDSGITEFAPPAGYETADGVDIAVNQDLSPDHKYRTANVNLPVSKTAYSVQIIYSGGNGTQIIEGKKVGDSIRISELVWPEGFSLVNFTDIYIDSKLAATAVNGVITLDVPVTSKGVVVTITYMAEGIPVGTQIRNEAGGALITADMLSVPYGYEMGTFDSVTAVSDMSLEIEVTLLKAKNVTVIPGQIVLILEKDKEGYASAIVSPANILDGSVSWESGNPAVAKVDEYGRIIPISKGSTVIKAVSNQTETAFGECMVTVVSLGDSYAEVLPYLTDWSNQSISAAINVHSDSGQTPGENIVKYKVTESASEPSYIDDGSWTDYTGPVSVSEDGIHYIHWYVQDLNGKSSQGVSNAYKIDTAPPEIINARAAVKSKSQIDLTAEAADSGSGLRGYAWYLTADGSETLLSTNKAFSHTGLKVGTDYSYKLVVTDMTGNRSEQTCTAKTDKNSGSGGGGGGTSAYTVTFDSRGGSEIDSVRVAWNGKITKPADPVREGYTFGGWFTDDECTKSYDFDSKITASFTLYAKWNENSQPPETWDNPFTDVKESDWFYGNVKYVYENKLFVGISDTLFAPNDNMTRAMLVQVLYRAEGEPSMENENWGYPFEDVDAGSWYGTAVYWARSNGIVKGYSDLEFAPDRLITREEIAAIMYRYAALKGTADEKKGDLSKFTDESLISGWARESMEWAVGCGLIMGKDNGIIDPLSGATRAEVAAILQRFIEMK